MRPTQILQNPSRPGDASRALPGHIKYRPQSMGRGTGGPPTGPQGFAHPGMPFNQQQQQQQPGPGGNGPHPQMLPPMSEQETTAYMELEARRAKRNHKIFLLSKDNGVMTPQDKNFVTRIQLQQLVAATGSPTDFAQNSMQSEDFYYQVYTSIRSTQRQNPNQPLGNFAQTYLFQTGNRQGNRRNGRPAENHMQRMELQVQRAVEAAKNKPKNPQLVIAGSLGKISFSNAKTPKPLLNIKRPEASGDAAQRPTSSRRPDSQGPATDPKTTLRSIESIYTTLMALEDHVRRLPALPAPGGMPDAEFEALHAEWVAYTNGLNAKLWADLKVMEPIGATTVHPFIALLAHAKGKKAIPRVFRHTSAEQKTTILTMIIYHLDQLDVTRGAHIVDGEMHLDAATREKVELFSLTIMPSLFSHINETPLAIVDGTLGLISRLNVDLIAKSRIGTSMLTMILSRAELIKQLGEADASMWQKW
jgi:DNA topoisomerase 2-associated protein PAT1